MKKVLYRVLLFSIIISCQQVNNKEAKEDPAPFIDMKTFFRNADKYTFRISPDGNYFSYRADYKGMMNIFVQKTTDSIPVRVTNDTARSIGLYFWKADRIIYTQDSGGDENDQVFSVKYDGTDPRSLTAFPGVRTETLDQLNDVEGREKELLVLINKRVKEYFDPYLLNIETGALTLLLENNQNYSGWVTDNNGVIRLASKTDGPNATWYYRHTQKDPFSELLTTSFKEEFSIRAFDKNNKNIYVLSNIDRDKKTLVEYDPIAKKEVKEMFGNDHYDLGEVLYDRKKQALIGVSWQAEKEEWHFFDAQWQEIYKGIHKELGAYNSKVISYDNARKSGIVLTESDRMPPRYYLYDFNTKALDLVANSFPWINEKHMSYVKPIQYLSRDSLTIHGYLTQPLGLNPKNLPVVVNPHGGPWDRDIWAFNPEVQFLANRGYVVLQINFRGSTGYGKKFWQASFRQWGLKMQDDVTDAVQWLIKEGIADSNRVAIYGASYGGYATLAGITFTPDLYAAAIDYVGVSNMFTFMNTIPPYWKPYLDQLYEMVGNPKNPKDSLLLAAASPALHADKIKTPLFIAQGANDPRVNKAESDQMVEALRKRGVQVEYMMKEDEGHGFYNQDNQYDFYNAMEKFLAKHLQKKTVAN